MSAEIQPLKAADVFAAWRAVEPLFRSRHFSPVQWLALVQACAAGPGGVLFAKLSPRARAVGYTVTFNLASVRKWQKAGLVTTAYDYQHGKPGRAPLRIFATEKLSALLRMS